jgi:hypothetical protein
MMENGKMFVLFNPVEWTSANNAVYGALNDWNGTA